MDYIGIANELTYKVEQLGNTPQALADAALHEALKAARHPMIIVGPAALAREDGQAIFAACKKIGTDFCQRDGWNGFNILHHAAGRVGALDLGFVPSQGGKNIAEIFAGAQKGEVKFVYLLGADEFDMALLGKAFVVYQGHHGDDGAHRADVVLPAAAYTEKEATFVNLEGRVQRAKRAVFPRGQAREDWVIVRMLSDVIGKPLPYTSLSDLRARMVKFAPHFARVGEVISSPSTPLRQSSGGQAISALPMEPFINNFYMTDPISRASKTMAECTKNIANPTAKKVA